MSLVVAICGMAGAGKSEARKFFESKGYEYIHLGCTEETLKRYGKTTEELERIVRLDMRKQYGMGGMAVIVMDKLKKLRENGKDIVIDNMYSWSEYKIFKEEFKGDFHTIAIHASPKVRYDRQMNREHELRHGKGYEMNLETCIARDHKELEEIEKGGPIAMADYHFVNEGTQEELTNKMEEIYSKIA